MSMSGTGFAEREYESLYAQPELETEYEYEYEGEGEIHPYSNPEYEFEGEMSGEFEWEWEDETNHFAQPEAAGESHPYAAPQGETEFEYEFEYEAHPYAQTELEADQFLPLLAPLAIKAALPLAKKFALPMIKKVAAKGIKRLLPQAKRMARRVARDIMSSGRPSRPRYRLPAPGSVPGRTWPGPGYRPQPDHLPRPVYRRQTARGPVYSKPGMPGGAGYRPGMPGGPIPVPGGAGMPVAPGWAGPQRGPRRRWVGPRRRRSWQRYRGPTVAGLFRQLSQIFGEGESEAGHLEAQFFGSPETQGEIAAHEYAHEAALTEVLAAEASHTESENEAEAILATALPVTIKIMGATRILRPVTPALVQANASMVRSLHRSGPAGRQLLGLNQAVVRRTVGSLKAAHRAGIPVTPALARATMAGQAARVMSNPRLAGRSLARNLAIRRATVAPPRRRPAYNRPLYR